MMLSAKDFRNVWEQQNPKVIHIPSGYELGLMEQYAKYYHEQLVKNCSLPPVSDRVVDDLGFEVHEISKSMSDDDWNNALTSHGIWLKMAAEDAADKLYSEHGR